MMGPKKQDFCPRINMLKGNFENQSFLNWFFYSYIIFGAKFAISGTNWVEKTPIYIFPTFGSTINEFERKNLEKFQKFQKPKSYKQFP